jgi:hypothetical protein
MSQREIPRSDWLATVEEWPREAPERTYAVDQPLESLGTDDGAIAMHLGNETLRVDAPRALRVDVSARGEELGLDLEELDGVAPSEL